MIFPMVLCDEAVKKTCCNIIMRIAQHSHSSPFAKTQQELFRRRAEMLGREVMSLRDGEEIVKFILKYPKYKYKNHVTRNEMIGYELITQKRFSPIVQRLNRLHKI